MFSLQHPSKMHVCVQLSSWARVWRSRWCSFLDSSDVNLRFLVIFTAASTLHLGCVCVCVQCFIPKSLVIYVLCKNSIDGLEFSLPTLVQCWNRSLHLRVSREYGIILILAASPCTCKFGWASYWFYRLPYKTAVYHGMIWENLWLLVLGSSNINCPGRAVQRDGRAHW